MELKTAASCRIALLSWLIVVSFTVAWADETTIPSKKLKSIFPTAKNFAKKKTGLTPEKVASIEEEIGTALRPEDLKPTFYIAFNENKKEIGLALLVDVKGPNGVISGGVGLDMTGKVVKVEVHKHSEVSGIAVAKFLKQFSGKGIDDKFKVGEDVEPVAGQEEASQAVARLPQKTLALSYALFLKKKEKPKVEAPADQHDHSHGHGDDTDEFEDLEALMHTMHESYIVIREYFKTGENKADAVKVAKQLGEYAELIPMFVPPKNPNNEEEYAYLQKQAHDALHEFAESLEKEGTSDKTKKQWQGIIDLVNKAHLRFSVEEIELDEDLN